MPHVQQAHLRPPGAAPQHRHPAGRAGITPLNPDTWREEPARGARARQPGDRRGERAPSHCTESQQRMNTMATGGGNLVTTVRRRTCEGCCCQATSPEMATSYALVSERLTQATHMSRYRNVPSIPPPPLPPSLFYFLFLSPRSLSTLSLYALVFLSKWGSAVML